MLIIHLCNDVHYLTQVSREITTASVKLVKLIIALQILQTKKKQMINTRNSKCQT